MAQDIVGSLFGPTPYEIQQNQRKAMDEMAWKYAQAEPFVGARAGLFSAAGGLAGAGADALGWKNPEVEQARAREAAMTGFDPSSSKSILEKAASVSDPKLKMQLQILGNQRAAEEQKMALEAKKATTEEMYKAAQAKKDLALAEKALRENPNLAVTEVGVPGRPGWLQRVLFDKTNPKAAYQEIGEPYQTAQAMKIEIGKGVGGAGPTKPKNLSKPASLKWDLDHGLIDQETYEAEMEATPGGKVRAEQGKAAKSASAFLAEAGYDPKTGTDKISEWIKKSTSGRGEAAGAEVASWFGASTEGRKAINKLASTASRLTMALMGGKLGAGISNADRDFVLLQLGDVANAAKGADERLAAWQAAVERMKELSGIASIPPKDSKQNPSGGQLSAAEQAELAQLRKRFNKGGSTNE